MKIYDLTKAQQIVNEKRELIENAFLGMEEDWQWTRKDITDEDIVNLPHINGINGSAWATPILRIEYKNGDKEDIECFIEDDVEATEEEIEKMKEFARETKPFGFIFNP